MNFKKMWEVSEIPVYVLVAWSILSVIVMAYDILSQILLGAVGYAIALGAFGYIGYSVIQSKETFGTAAKTGAFAGVIIGLVGAVISIISFYVFPEMYADIITQAAAASQMPVDTVETYVLIGTYFGLISQPVVSAIMGAIFACAGGLFHRWTKK